MVFEILKDRILKDGKCFDGGVLKVDRFINHQMDPYMMKQVAVEFIRRFSDLQVNKIVTVEASGIAPSIMLGYMMELPVVFAKKKLPSTMQDAYVTTVHSFTKQSDTQLMISREYLTADDHVTTSLSGIAKGVSYFLREFRSHNFSIVLFHKFKHFFINRIKRLFLYKIGLLCQESTEEEAVQRRNSAEEKSRRRSISAKQ